MRSHGSSMQPLQLVTEVEPRTLEHLRNHLMDHVLQSYYVGDQPRVSPAIRVGAHDWLVQQAAADLSMSPGIGGSGTNIVGGVSNGASSVGRAKNNPSTGAYSTAAESNDSSARAVHFAPAVAQTPTSLSPEEDCKEASSNKQIYWYNPRTCATAWSKEELIEMNKKFYNRIRYQQSTSNKTGANGETSYWLWTSANGLIISDWDLKGLWGQLKRQNHV